jgi:hypothetical protein
MEGQPEPIVVSIWWIYGAIAFYCVSFVLAQIGFITDPAMREQLREGRCKVADVWFAMFLSLVPLMNTFVAVSILGTPLLMWLYTKLAHIDFNWKVDYSKPTEGGKL